MVSVSSIVTFDIYKRYFKPDAQNKSMIRVSHITCIVFWVWYCWIQYYVTLCWNQYDLVYLLLSYSYLPWCDPYYIDSDLG